MTQERNVCAFVVRGILIFRAEFRRGAGAGNALGPGLCTYTRRKPTRAPISNHHGAVRVFVRRDARPRSRFGDEGWGTLSLYNISFASVCSTMTFFLNRVFSTLKAYLIRSAIVIVVRDLIGRLYYCSQTWSVHVIPRTIILNVPTLKIFYRAIFYSIVLLPMSDTLD